MVYSGYRKVMDMAELAVSLTGDFDISNAGQIKDRVRALLWSVPATAGLSRLALACNRGGISTNPFWKQSARSFSHEHP
jgi:hypothetical protein